MKTMNIIILLISSVPLVAQNQSVSIYKKIQPINLSTLSWEDEEWPNESFEEYLNRCLNYQMNPQEIKKRRIVFRLFDSIAAKNKI